MVFTENTFLLKTVINFNIFIQECSTEVFGEFEERGHMLLRKGVARLNCTITVVGETNQASSSSATRHQFVVDVKDHTTTR